METASATASVTMLPMSRTSHTIHRQKLGFSKVSRVSGVRVGIGIGLVSVVTPPFPQIDIIGAVVIVWRVRGKTIKSVLCNIVCNSAQCDAHT